MDTKSGFKSSTITEQDSNSFFNMFSCCKPSPRHANPKATKSSMSHPVSSLTLSNSPNKVSNKYSEAGLATRFTFGIPYSNSKGQSIFEKDDLPFNMVFILGDKNKIVAKITHKKVEAGPEPQFLRISTTSEVTVSSNMMRESIDSMKSIKKEKKESFKDSLLNTLRRRLLSRQNKTVSAEENSGLIPENIARHIATRLKCDIIIDALCGCGGTALQVSYYFPPALQKIFIHFLLSNFN